MKNNIGVIGYTRVAPKSNTNGIADYYVRASILDTKNNNKLYDNPENIFNLMKLMEGVFRQR